MNSRRRTGLRESALGGILNIVLWLCQGATSASEHTGNVKQGFFACSVSWLYGHSKWKGEKAGFFVIERNTTLVAKV